MCGIDVDSCSVACLLGDCINWLVVIKTHVEIFKSYYSGLGYHAGMCQA